MRVFVILLLCLALFCPMTAQTRPVATTVDSAFMAKTDSLSVAIRDLKWRLDSLAIAKGQQEKLLQNAEDRLSQSLTVLEVVLGFAALLAIILGWLGKSAISNFNKNMRELTGAKAGLDRQVQRAQKAETAFKDSADRLEERIAVLKTEFATTFVSQADLQNDLEGMRTQMGTSLSQFVRLTDAQKDMEKLRSEIGTVATEASTSGEIRNKLEEFSQKLRDLERAGGKLTSADYVTRALDQLTKDLDDLALISAESAIELDPKSAGAWLIRGLALERLKRFEQALSAYDMSIKYNDDLPEAHDFRSDMLLQLEQAVPALAARVNAAERYYKRSVAEAIKGELLPAMRDLERAIDLVPSYKESARKDVAFDAYRENDDFKKIVGE